MGWLDVAHATIASIFGSTAVSNSDTCHGTYQQSAAPKDSKDKISIMHMPQSGEGLINSMLGADELCHIFDMLSPQDLLTRAALVCKRWANVAQSDEAWQPRMHREDAADLRDAFYVLRTMPLRRLYNLAKPANLVQNSLLRPSAQSPRVYGPVASNEPWRVTMHKGHGWCWEAGGGNGIPAEANDALPRPLAALREEPPNPDGPPGAVASSFLWCELMQPVNLVGGALQDRGFTSAEAHQLLDAAPPLEFSVCLGGRFDCQAECEVLVVLDDGSQPLPLYVGRHPFPWDQGSLASWYSGPLHPDNGAWHSVTACLHGYPSGVRRAIVVLRGKDLQFWAGHYGGKFAAPQLRFIPPREVPAALQRHGTVQKLEAVAI